MALLGLTHSTTIISTCRWQHPGCEPQQHLQLLHDPGAAAWHRIHCHHQPHLWRCWGASGEQKSNHRWVPHSRGIGRGGSPRGHRLGWDCAGSTELMSFVVTILPIIWCKEQLWRCDTWGRHSVGVVVMGWQLDLMLDDLRGLFQPQWFYDLQPGGQDYLQLKADVNFSLITAAMRKSIKESKSLLWETRVGYA